MTEVLKFCRICKSEGLIDALGLGNQIITSRFPMLGDFTTPSAPIVLVMCSSCSLVQLKHTTPSSEMYEHFYGYRSGLNATMRNHLALYNNDLQAMSDVQPGDSVLDIGSNDCTFLSQYKNGVNRFGCDPTGIQFSEFYETHSVKLVPTYFTKSNVQNVLGTKLRFKAVSSIAMFYDLPDPVQFAKDIYDLLDDDGIWTFEQSYVLTMLERNSIDTICHEHLEYYGVKQIKKIMDLAGFKIVNISLNESNGGSFRTYVAKAASTKHTEAIDLVNTFLQNEEVNKIHTGKRYTEFMLSCSSEIKKLTQFLKLAKADGKKVYIYGASTKGNCLLQFANITSDLVEYAVERNLMKVGRMTSTGVEIISEETMRLNPPSYMLVLPWHFRTEMIEREKVFLENGGQLIFPFPKFEVYSSKPKTLVTGVAGQIGSYVVDALADTDVLYGAVSKKKTLT
jgi:hypothetical protein